MSSNAALMDAKAVQVSGGSLTTEQEQLLAAYAHQQATNRKYMVFSIKRPSAGDAQNSTAYMSGSNTPNLSQWYCPIIPGAWVTSIMIRATLNVDYTPAATDPVASLNAAAPWNAIGNITVKYGNQIGSVNPIALLVQKMMSRVLAPQFGQLITGGYADPGVRAMFYGTPTLHSGNNAWEFELEFPLTAVHPELLNGAIPIGGTGTRLEVTVQSATAFTGVDPMDNVVSTNGTVAVSGNYQVIFMRRGQTSMNFATQSIQPNVTTPYQYPYPQYVRPATINPLTGGQKVGKTLSLPYKVVRLINFVIDGNQSDQFAASSNIQAYELDKADDDTAILFRYDVTDAGTSQPMSNYYRQIAEIFGQDMLPGVLVWDASTMNTVNPSNLTGESYLDLTASGYAAARQRFQVKTVGAVAGITPRVDTYALVMNDAGLYVQAAGE